LTTQEHPVCPHCNQPLQAFELPDGAGWDSEFQLASFNDDCPYYVRGWEHMESNYAVKASYRFRIDPFTGEKSPIAVWSSDALKDRIIEAVIGDQTDPDVADEGDENGGST
jgi:hypothetical protein